MSSLEAQEHVARGADKRPGAKLRRRLKKEKPVSASASASASTATTAPPSDDASLAPPSGTPAMKLPPDAVTGVHLLPGQKPPSTVRAGDGMRWVAVDSSRRPKTSTVRYAFQCSADCGIMFPLDVGAGTPKQNCPCGHGAVKTFIAIPRS
jgi:hypothetical protein